MKVLCVVGARPNYMKVAPVWEALRSRGHEASIVHTGQHYDQRMSEVFFDELGLPRPDVNLGVGSASQAVQTARVLEAFEPIVLDTNPDLVLVAGDVNSTLACALVAAKLHVPVAHLEAGLRSRDRTMPEEVNRVLTDHASDILLTPSADADANLRAEGIPPERIFLVGNAMIDTLLKHVETARHRPIVAELGLREKGFALLTLHRPSNVDHATTLGGLINACATLSKDLPVVFPVHPRTDQRLQEFGLREVASRLVLIGPLGYLDFLALECAAALVLTDSGGIQEETTVLGVPCLTLRENTERPVTISLGTNQLVGTKPEDIEAAATEVLLGKRRKGCVPPLWDGAAGERVAHTIEAAIALPPRASMDR